MQGLLVFVELKDEVADLVAGRSNREVNSWVCGIAVVLEAGEATLGKCVHFINYSF